MNVWDAVKQSLTLIVAVGGMTSLAFLGGLVVLFVAATIGF